MDFFILPFLFERQKILRKLRVNGAFSVLRDIYVKFLKGGFILKRKSIIAGLCACVVLLGASGCGGAGQIDVQSQTDTASVVEIPSEWLKREAPKDVRGKVERFTLNQDDYASTSTAAVTPVTLRCSDGVARKSFSVSEKPIYLSDDAEDGEGEKTANGVFSKSDNIALAGQVGLLQGATVDVVLDELIKRQAATLRDDSIFMFSNTLNPSPNVLLTSTICKEGKESVETFYVLQILDKETAQLFSLSRVSEEMDLTLEETEQMSIEELTKYCLSSGDNRNVFCGMLQSLLSQLAKS